MLLISQWKPWQPLTQHDRLIASDLWEWKGLNIAKLTENKTFKFLQSQFVYQICFTMCPRDHVVILLQLFQQFHFYTKIRGRHICECMADRRLWCSMLYRSPASFWTAPVSREHGDMWRGVLGPLCSRAQSWLQAVSEILENCPRQSDEHFEPSAVPRGMLCPPGRSCDSTWTVDTLSCAYLFMCLSTVGL